MIRDQTSVGGLSIQKGLEGANRPFAARRAAALFDSASLQGMSAGPYTS